MKAWYGCTVPDGASIADVYAGFSSGQLDKNLPIPEEYQAAVDVKVGKCRTDQIAVSLDCSATEVVSSLGQYMDFAVHGAIETMPLSKPDRDASAVLMQSSRSCHVLYVCGDSFADVECDDDSTLNNNFSSIEIPYCSAGNTLICFICASEEDLKEQTDTYPICVSCYSSGKRSPAKRTRQFRLKD